jgi:hypothetical protein
VKSAGTAYFTSAGYTQDFNALIAGIKGLDFSSYDTLQTSIDAIPTGSTVSRGTIIRDAGSAVYSRATDLLGEKASDTVPADLASQLLAQYEATDPEYQGYISDAKALLLKKQETFAQLQDLQQQTAAKAQDVARHMATIEALVKPLRDAKLAIDTPVLAAVADLRRDAERRLRYYLYLIALAYEYRLLQPYRSPLNVNLDVKQLQNAADANQTELTTDQARDLMVPYEKVLSQITEEIINAYDLQQKPIEQQLTRSIRLSDNECTRLGKGERVEINLALRPEFAGLTQENLRLVGVALESMNGIEAKPASVDVLMRHEGVSLIKAGTTIHGFRHLGYDGQAFLNWRSNYDFKTDVIHNSTPSEAAESLLLSRLNTPSDKFVLFASPGLDAGLVLSLEPSSVRLQLSEVVFSVHYTYQQT